MQLAVILAGVTVSVAIGAYLGWVLWSNRRAGTPGLVRRRRLTCPKCGGTFDFAFVPGASVNSLRLGRSRYMACPLCHRWAVIRMDGPPIGDAPRPSPSVPAR